MLNLLAQILHPTAKVARNEGCQRQFHSALTLNLRQRCGVSCGGSWRCCFSSYVLSDIRSWLSACLSFWREQLSSPKWPWCPRSQSLEGKFSCDHVQHSKKHPSSNHCRPCWPPRPLNNFRLLALAWRDLGQLVCDKPEQAFHVSISWSKSFHITLGWHNHVRD